MRPTSAWRSPRAMASTIAATLEPRPEARAVRRSTAEASGPAPPRSTASSDSGGGAVYSGDDGLVRSRDSFDDRALRTARGPSGPRRRWPGLDGKHHHEGHRPQAADARPGAHPRRLCRVCRRRPHAVRAARGQARKGRRQLHARLCGARQGLASRATLSTARSADDRVRRRAIAAALGHGRRDRGRRRRARHRFGRELRPGGRARPAAPHRHDREAGRRGGASGRRRDLRVHQPRAHRAHARRWRCAR